MVNDVEMRGTREPWGWSGLPVLSRWFEGFPAMFRDEDRLRIEQELKDDTMVIRAEMPGIDPDKDVEITLDDGMLSIRGERRSEQAEEEDGRRWSEFRYGSFTRAVRVPEGMDADEVSATYKDGILEVTFPYKVPTEAAPHKVPVSRS